jgi:hypothetical protein
MSKEIEALLIEHDGYVRRGLKDRAKQTEKVLESLGHKVKQAAPAKETSSVEPESERAVTPRASKRKV